MSGGVTVITERKRIAGISTRASNLNSEPIVELWGRFFEQGLPQRLGGGIFSVYYDYELDHAKQYTVLVGCEVPPGASLPAGLTEHCIEPGNYEVFDASGPLPQSILNGWLQIWQADLDRVYRTDFEQYMPDESQAIYIGVR